MPYSPPAADDPMVGRVVEGQFRVLRRLGRGSMGAVYEAEHLRTRARFALKVLSAKMGRAGDLEARFEREARASGLMQHPNIVAVQAFGRLDDGVPYLVMELVSGPELGDLLEKGPLTAERSLLVARQILSGVGYAHSLGMVHRDMKPDNVMLGRGPGGVDQVKILDFGIVKLIGELAAAEVGTETLTQTGVVFGTPAYMAPEQALARELDGRADLYAVGCILFEMLIGAPPFRGRDAIEILKQHVSAAPPALASAGLDPSHCTEALESLVARALAKKPADRFASASDMIAAVDAAFESLAGA
jgi:eukaryotic-like serine/threonine-protein kinase